MAHEDQLNAALAGRYRVLHEIGSGGMAQGFENRSPRLFQLNDADFDPLRDDPRFDELLARLGLPVEEGD